MLLLALAANQIAFADGSSRKILSGHFPKAARNLIPKASLPTDSQMSLALGLPLNDLAGLEDLLQRMYNPEDPLYRKFLSPEEFTKRFGPTPEQYNRVVSFAERNHLKVAARHSNRMVIDVRGSVADVQRAFQITLQTYKHPRENRDFYAPDAEPSVESELPLADVSGLNNYALPHPRIARMDAITAQSVPRVGSGAGGTYMGNDFRAAYLPGVTLTGAGQILGLVQFDGFFDADIASYEAAAGLPQVPLETILLDGYNGVPTSGANSGNGEVSLDIEMAVSMAPGLSKIVLFEAGPNGYQNDILSAMSAHSEIKQLSCSWGWGGGPSTTTDNLFRKMAAQGQSFFSASGDSDAFPTGAIEDPSQPNSPSGDPYITVVGGTSLSTSGPGGSRTSETVWNRGNGIGSSGGISSHYGLPTWQQGIDMTSNGGSTSYRNTPDVAFVAENVFVVYGNGTNGSFGGTSCAAPLWGALTALINQQTVLAGQPAVGFINPALYAIGKSANYGAAFHDVTTGNNTWSGSANSFNAVPGYDLCTGWGTPAGQNLIDALAGPHDPLMILPTTGFTLAGPQGGPFVPAAVQWVLTNSDTAPIRWSVGTTSTWITMNPLNGTLAARSSETITTMLTSDATALPQGNYSAGIDFTNQVSGQLQHGAVALQIGQSIVQNGGFETGDFTDWTLVGHSVASGSGNGPTVYNAVEPGGSGGYQVAHSGNYGAFLGDTQIATLAQTLNTVPGGRYLVSFWLNNPSSGSGQHFWLNWNSGALTNTLLSLDNPGVLNWTNLQFVVTATQSSSILEFGAENDSAGFGLDDVIVQPIPNLSFTGIEITPGGCNLSWRTSTGMKYQLQSTTDWTQAGWTNVGAVIAGTGQVVSTIDPSGTAPSPPRFYRLIEAQ